MGIECREQALEVSECDCPEGRQNQLQSILTPYYEPPVSDCYGTRSEEDLACIANVIQRELLSDNGVVM